MQDHSDCRRASLQAPLDPLGVQQCHAVHTASVAEAVIIFCKQRPWTVSANAYRWHGSLARSADRGALLRGRLEQSLRASPQCERAGRAGGAYGPQHNDS